MELVEKQKSYTRKVKKLRFVFCIRINHYFEFFINIFYTSHTSPLIPSSLYLLFQIFLHIFSLSLHFSPPFYSQRRKRRQEKGKTNVDDAVSHFPRTDFSPRACPLALSLARAKSSRRQHAQALGREQKIVYKLCDK